MDLRFDERQADLRRRARDFAERHLIPYEAECEGRGGLSSDSLKAVHDATLEAGLGAINHSAADGGVGLGLFDQVLVQEQLGRATGALWDLVWRPAIPLAAGTEEQKETYLRPACRGERRDCYAITEEGAGSDPSMVRTVARRAGDDFVITGEKWHVTAGDVADFLLVHAHVDGDPNKPTILIIDRDLPGVRLVRTPRYMHTFVFEHPIFALEEVRVPRTRVLGEIGGGGELTRDWFVEERLMIGARTVGAATRALELSTAFARRRVQFGSALVGHQGVAFMLADMAAELMAARALLYRVGWEAPHLVRRDLHGQAAAVKLLCSETAGRIVDRAVQVHGGRGYMREEPVERLYRELRVDRIWEGTSEIQRQIIGNELAKRGPDLYAGWPERPDLP